MLIFWKLNDNWDYAPDEAVARTVFAKLSLSSGRDRQQSLSSSLCPRCKDLRLWLASCNFQDCLEELEEKANRHDCALCKLLSHSAHIRSKRRREFVRFVRVSSYLTIAEGEGEPIANLYTTPEFQRTDLETVQLGFPRLPDAGGVIHINILMEWIHGCDKAHQCYVKGEGFLPTRLLDVSNVESGTIRLLEYDRGYTGTETYIALSHRWGSPSKGTFFCTYNSNIEKFRRGIEISSLPKTFQDAVYITNKLGQTRLWIDSLCIIQDNEDDWNTESRFMERVFSSAYCVIAASCANGSNDGFLEPPLERRCVTMNVHGAKGTYYVCEAIDNFYRDVDQSELNQRGWVLQERALARRTIFFTETQTYWECGKGVRCETMTMMKNRKASFLGDADFPRAAERYVKGMRIELFEELYQRYSHLALSFPADRPIAIQGLETRLLRTFDTTGGYGILDKYLHRSLLWQKAGDNLKRIESFRWGKMVPSWSWMSYEGPIHYMRAPFGEVSWCEDIESPFTQPRQSKIHYNSGHEEEEIEASRMELKAPIWGIFDAPGQQRIMDDKSRRVTHPLQCVVVGMSKKDPLSKRQTHYVLLVHTVDGGGRDQVYERVGVGILERQNIAFEEPQRMACIR